MDSSQESIQWKNLSDNFLVEVQDVWQHGFMGVDVGNIIIAIGIFFGFLVVRGVFSKYVLYRLHKLTEKSNTEADDKVIEALIPPIKFIPIILGFFFAGNYLNFSPDVEVIFNSFIRSLIAFNIFWAIHRAVEPISHMFERLERLLSKAMVTWIFKFVKFLVIFIGAAVILEIWGIKVGPLLAGLGLFGAAIALGAQDLFKNLIGGLTIIAEKRFHPGEWIKVEGIVEGTVEEIGFRSTKVIRFDKAPVHVPNSQLSDAAVTNFSRMSNRRIFWMVGVTYDTTAKQLKEIRDGIMGYIQTCDDFEKRDDLATFVRVDSFNASSIDIMVYCFTKTIVWGEFLEAKEKFAFEVKRIVEGAGSSFAFPSQSLYLESWPGDSAEIFNPPEGKAKPKKKAA